MRQGQRTLVDVGYRSRRRPRHASRQRPTPITPPAKLSRVRDRTVGERWAAYLAAARARAGMTKAELARAANVGRATVFRWEAGESRPEQAEIVARVANVLGIELDEALIAAGLRPGEVAPNQPSTQTVLDPRARAIAESLQIMSDRLNDPSISNDERLLIEAQLDMLVDLARQRAARRRART